MLPILTQLVEAILGDRQSLNTLLLSALYSPGGSQNLYLDKLGRIRQIDGWTRQNATAITTDTGATAATFRSLFHYKKVGGGTTTRQLLGLLDDAVNEWELWQSTDEGVTWTFIAGGDRGATPVGFLPDWAQFGDTLIITVPKTEVPRQWDGTTLSATGGTQLGAPTATDAAVSGFLSGTYTYRVLPRKTNGDRKIASVISNLLRLSNSQTTLSWTADTDTDVGGYETYRTSGTGKIFYFVDYVSGRLTVSFTDNVTDGTIIEARTLDEHGDAPPSGVYFVEAHKQRLWYYRTDTDPRRAYYSDPGDPDSLWKDFNYIDFTDADSFGDVGTGMTGNFEGMAVAWQERSVWTVSGSGLVVGTIVDWNRRRTNAQIGTVTHRTVLRIPAGAKYVDSKGEPHQTTAVTLAYLSPLKDIRLFDGNNDTIISDAKKDALTLINYAQRAKCHAALHTAYGLAVWYYPKSAATECDTAVVWDYIRGTWHEWTDQNFSAVIEVESSTAAQVLLAAETRVATGGRIYKLWNGNTFDGANITPIFMTKALFLQKEPGLPPDFLSMKRHRFVDLLFVKDASPTTVTIGWLPFDAADSDAVAGSITVSGTSRKRAKLKSGGQYYHKEGIRLKVSSAATTGPWALDALNFGYQIFASHKRG